MPTSFTQSRDLGAIHHSQEKKMAPTPVFLPGESQGWGSLVGCRLWGHTESDTTEATQQQQQQQQHSQKRHLSFLGGDESSGMMKAVEVEDWLDLLAVQGTRKSLLQHHSSKASILQHSAFLKVQLSHPYLTTGKTIALTRQTFVGKVMSLLFNMLFRLVITFFSKSKCLLISSVQSSSAVILQPPKIKSVTVSIVYP